MNIETAQPMTVIVHTREHIIKAHGPIRGPSLETINGIVGALKNSETTVLAGWDVEYIPRHTQPKRQIRMRMFPA